MEGNGDHGRDGGEHEHHGSGGTGPGRRHPVAGQVAGYQVEEAGHGGCTGELEDGDRADVVERSEALTEVLVCQIGQRPALRFIAVHERGCGDKQGGHEARGDEEPAHDQGGRGEQLPGAGDAAFGVLFGVVRPVLDLGHDDDAGFEPGQAQRQSREDQEGDADHRQGVAVLDGQQGPPVLDGLRRDGDLPGGSHDDHEIEDQEHGNNDDGDADGFPEPAEEDDGEEQQEPERHRHFLSVQPGRREWILDQVGCGVRGREGHGDGETGGGETEQYEHEHLAPPLGEELLQHGDGAFTVRALTRHALVDRQCTEQGDDNQDERGDRGECTGGCGGDGRLVSEGGEVLDAGQAHDPPPRLLLVIGAAGRVRMPLVFVVEQPVPQTAAMAGLDEAVAKYAHGSKLCPAFGAGREIYGSLMRILFLRARTGSPCCFR